MTNLLLEIDELLEDVENASSKQLKAKLAQARREVHTRPNDDAIAKRYYALRRVLATPKLLR